MNYDGKFEPMIINDTAFIWWTTPKATIKALQALGFTVYLDDGYND